MSLDYKIAIYIRLSREDGDDLESESVINQRSLLNCYLDKQNLNLVDTYVDDGYTGTNFERPEFNRLISDIKRGKINMVITKDLSRLGRDHVMTGYYVESFFPNNNVRYVALNDDIDTFLETSGMDMMPFKLSMNDMYAKDISKKVRSNLLQMKKDGKFCGSLPPYGYMRDPLDKHKLVPNPDTAPIVKRIFDLYVNGVSSSHIAEILTKENIPTPIMYKYSDSSLKRITHPEIWRHTSISNIIKNKVYIGDLIQHKVQKVNYKIKKRRLVSENEWCIKENAHEPLIDKNTFFLAQSIKNSKNNYMTDRRDVVYALSDMVFCKDCGSKMSISYDKKRDRITMNCNNYRKFSKYNICFSHYINYSKLERTIYKRIRYLIKRYTIDIEKFKNIIKSKNDTPYYGIIDKIDRLNNILDDLRKKQDCLYDDKYNNIINLNTFKRLFNDTEEKINKIKLDLIKLEKEKNIISNNNFDSIKCMDIINNYLDVKNPTKEMINKIIDKIYVSKDKTVEIHYRIRE